MNYISEVYQESFRINFIKMMKSLELLDSEVSTEQSRDLINRVQLLEANVQSVLDTDYSILIPVYETACQICTLEQDDDSDAVYSCSFCNYYKELNKKGGE